MVLIPVERTIGLPVARVCRKRLSSVREAEAILKQGMSNRFIKSTDCSSQQEANHGILTARQYASISLYSAKPNSSARFRSPFVVPKGDSRGLESSSAV